MKTIALFIAAGLVFTAFGQDNAQDPTKKYENKKATKVADPPVIPKDATPLPDGSYRYVDKDGKKWIYRTTPFGVSKAEERPVAQQVQRIEDDPAKSQDLGDSVRFTRPTPFGPKVWTRKKTELDTYEKSIWDRDQQKTQQKNAPAADSRHDGAASHSTPAAKQD